MSVMYGKTTARLTDSILTIPELLSNKIALLRREKKVKDDSISGSSTLLGKVISIS